MVTYTVLTLQEQRRSNTNQPTLHHAHAMKASKHKTKHDGEKGQTLAMIAMRSPNRSASSMKWVVKIMIRPSRAFCSTHHAISTFESFQTAARTFSICHVDRREYGSIPEVGSSKITTFDPPINAMPTLSLRFMPPLNAADTTSTCHGTETQHRDNDVPKATLTWN